MKPCIVSLPGSDLFADRIAQRLGSERIPVEYRRFPDGESYLRLEREVTDRDVAIVAQLRDPDPMLPSLLFLADALRDLGARSVGLVAPYLPYMRQDTRFRDGEAITSRSFAKWVSAACEWLVTVDPHLHRRRSLNEIYGIPSLVVPSAAAMAAWVQGHVQHACILGPDAESAQWVAEVASFIGCPHATLDKRRRGDRDVALALPDLAPLRGRTPVLVDDIISSAHTMSRAVGLLLDAGMAAPVCIAVHAVFAGDAASLLEKAGAARVVSCNTLTHRSNAIDVTGAVAEAIKVEWEALTAGRRD